MSKLWRPYLSLPKIEHICSLLSQDLSTPAAKTAYNKLFRIKLEAEIGLRQAAHTLKPTLLQKLEGQVQSEETVQPSESLWEIYNTNPASLSLVQIRAAKTYGWEQGLMSQVEAVLFEKEIGL